MNNVFDINRFGKYFMYELGRAKVNFMASAIVCGISPAIFLAIFEFFSFLFSGEHVSGMETLAQGCGLFTILIVFTLVMPVKLFGQITEKRFGSNWLMMPASVLEKTITMILMVCVVAPAFTAAVYFATDGILSLCFPVAYGGSIFSSLKGLNEAMKVFSEINITFNLWGLLIIDYIVWTLIFLLGSIFFKDRKVIKTILVILLLGMAGSTLFGTLVSLVGFGGLESMFRSVEDDFLMVEHAFTCFNIFLNCYYFILIAGLSVGIFFRVKTLKQ